MKTEYRGGKSSTLSDDGLMMAEKIEQSNKIIHDTAQYGRGETTNQRVGFTGTALKEGLGTRIPGRPPSFGH